MVSSAKTTLFKHEIVILEAYIKFFDNYIIIILVLLFSLYANYNNKGNFLLSELGNSVQKSYLKFNLKTSYYNHISISFHV